ncbi:MAG TPA: HAD family phosphatase [Blastocatellia bacterium]|nr:HAD family phosphatase [Blastocatellia bacterium]
MLRAIIFDCDGVIADTEPLHFAALKRVLDEEGIPITKEKYYREYLALDDRGCFTKAFRESAKPLTDEKLAELIARKASYIDPVMREELILFPGVRELIKEAASRYPLAIASGALRNEIELILKCGGVSDYFVTIVSAEDVERGKPDPESFLKACEQISAAVNETIAPRECLVIEDSIHGIHAAQAAGMLCLAVANSYPKEKLAEAGHVVETLVGLSLKKLESFFDR